MAQQCLDRDIKISPTGSRVTVEFAGKTVADTDNALDLVEGGYPVRIYIPVADVDAGVLKDSATHSTCPFKGEASYHTLEHDGETATDAVWYYPDPCPQVARIKDHVAFWGDQIRLRKH